MRFCAHGTKGVGQGEVVVRAPESGSYRGATVPGYSVVKNNGLIALTRGRVKHLILQTAAGEIGFYVTDTASWIAALRQCQRSF